MVDTMQKTPEALQNTIRFTPGQQKVLDGTVDAYAILKNMTYPEKTKWRLEQLKLIVRSKPAGFLFTNSYFQKRLGYPGNNAGFSAFKSTDIFKRTFTLTPEIGTFKFSLAVNEDARTVAKGDPSYKKPAPEADEKASPELAPEPVTAAMHPHDQLLDLARKVAVERLAREMTVGEVLDGAKEYGL